MENIAETTAQGLLLSVETSLLKDLSEGSQIEG